MYPFSIVGYFIHHHQLKLFERFELYQLKVLWMHQSFIKIYLMYILSPGYVYPKYLVVELLVVGDSISEAALLLQEFRRSGQHCLVFRSNHKSTQNPIVAGRVSRFGNGFDLIAVLIAF